MFMPTPQPGSYINILVSNWGLAIPKDKQDEVFLPFTRVEIRDEIKAKRGMGIGLYIARLFATSHLGDVTLSDSKGGFHDLSRRDHEGWTTQFEIRLSSNLPVGTRQYSLEDQMYKG